MGLAAVNTSFCGKYKTTNHRCILKKEQCYAWVNIYDRIPFQYHTSQLITRCYKVNPMPFAISKGFLLQSTICRCWSTCSIIGLLPTTHYGRLKYRDILFVRSIRFSCQSGRTTMKYVMGQWDITALGLKMRFGRMSPSAQPSWSALYWITIAELRVFPLYWRYI